MNIADKTLQLKKDFDDVYKAGQSSMVDESKIIEKTVSGEYISVDDVSEIPHEVKVKLTSGGKNLWKHGDVTFTLSGDYKISLEPGKTYTLSVVANSTDTDYEKCLVYDVTNSKALGDVKRGVRSTTTLKPTTNSLTIRFYASGGYGSSIGDTATFKDIMLNEGSTALPYEPYKETLTEYSGVSLTRCGGNLATVNSTSGSIVTIQLAYPIPANTPFTISGNFSTNSEKKMLCRCMSANETQLAAVYVDSSGFNRTFTDECTHIHFYASIDAVSSQGYAITIENLMINIGSTPLPYEPFKDQTLTAKADGTVEGVKSVSPRMYLTTDNQNVTINATYHRSYGIQTEYDRFWDSYQDNGNRVDYGYAFAGQGWSDNNFRCKYPIIITTSSPSIFQSCKITDTKESITFNTTVTGITPFYIASSLETIQEIILNRDISFGEYAFRNCSKLKNIKITGNGKIISSVGFQQSTLLTKESILSIFNALSSTISGLTLTLSTTAVTNAFGSTTSTEWTSLVATKTNWTISLV